MPSILSPKLLLNTGWMRVIVGTILTVASGLAQPHVIDAAHSVVKVRVFKAGLLSAFGHDHEIVAPISSGKVDPAAHKVELRFGAGDLQVEDPGISDADRKTIRQTMLGPDVLDATRYPEIAFRSTTATPASDPAQWIVRGELTLHGQVHPVVVEVREDQGVYRGTATVKQTTFGIKPVKVAGGAVRVKDDVRIEFTIQLTH
jgi:polyisoprenoid-binding protein YceI